MKTGAIISGGSSAYVMWNSVQGGWFYIVKSKPLTPIDSLWFDWFQWHGMRDLLLISAMQQADCWADLSDVSEGIDGLRSWRSLRRGRAIKKPAYAGQKNDGSLLHAERGCAPCIEAAFAN